MTDADKLYLKSLEDAVRLLNKAYCASPGTSQVGNFLLDARRYLISQIDAISGPILEVA